MTIEYGIVDSGDPQQPLHWVSTGVIELVFLPSSGGRLLSVRRGKHEYLWQNPEYFDSQLRATTLRASWPEESQEMGTWVNVGGSKTWPAPQGWDRDDQWHGPPDPIIDSGQWEFGVVSHTDNALTVHMESQDDPRTGLRITRRFALESGASTMRESVTFLNTSSRDVTWSVWEVCQIPFSPSPTSIRRIDVAIADDGEAVTSLLAAGEKITTRRRGESISIQPQDVVGKVGFPAATGTLAAQTGDLGRLSITWPVSVEAAYPERTRAEIWLQAPVEHPLETLGGLHPRAWVAELEPRFPLITLQPGERTSHDLDWQFD